MIELNEGEIHLCEWKHDMSGHFFTKLFDCMSSADQGNLFRLGLAFPDEVRAFMRFKTEEGYWQKVDAEFKKKWSVR